MKGENKPGKNGYSQKSINGIQDYEHRWQWKRYFGYIPVGMFVCHRCDNRWCVNPEHLFLGTHKDNMQDMKNKNRQRKSKMFDLGDVEHIQKSTFSQRALAKYYGCSQAMIWLIKHGKRVVDGLSQR